MNYRYNDNYISKTMNYRYNDNIISKNIVFKMKQVWICISLV